MNSEYTNYELTKEVETSETEKYFAGVSQRRAILISALGEGYYGFASYILDLDPHEEGRERPGGRNWGDPKYYNRLAGELLLHIPNLTTEKLNVLLDLIPDSTEMKNKYGLTAAGERLFVELLKEEVVGKGFSLTEIGGPVMKKIGDELGFDSQDNQGQMIDLQNWQAVLQANQDIAVTSWVLDYGSGVGNISEPVPGNQSMYAPDNLGSMELLLVLYNLTKDKGIGLHQEFRVDLNTNAGDYKGFEESLALAGWGMSPAKYGGDEKVVTLRKSKPKTNQIKLGQKTASYNSESDKWELVTD